MKKFKLLINSSMLKEAHKLTKQAKKQNPEINYKFQLGLELSNLLKVEKQNRIKMKISLAIIKLAETIGINKFDYVSGSDITRLENKLRTESKMKRLYFDKPMTIWDLSIYLTKQHFNSLKCLI